MESGVLISEVKVRPERMVPSAVLAPSTEAAADMGEGRKENGGGLGEEAYGSHNLLIFEVVCYRVTFLASFCEPGRPTDLTK